MRLHLFEGDASSKPCCMRQLSASISRHLSSRLVKHSGPEFSDWTTWIQSAWMDRSGVDRRADGDSWSTAMDVPSSARPKPSPQTTPSTMTEVQATTRIINWLRANPQEPPTIILLDSQRNLRKEKKKKELKTR